MIRLFCYCLPTTEVTDAGQWTYEEVCSHLRGLKLTDLSQVLYTRFSGHREVASQIARNNQAQAREITEFFKNQTLNLRSLAQSLLPSTYLILLPSFFFNKLSENKYILNRTGINYEMVIPKEQTTSPQQFVSLMIASNKLDLGKLHYQSDTLLKNLQASSLSNHSLEPNELSHLLVRLQKLREAFQNLQNTRCREPTFSQDLVLSSVLDPAMFTISAQMTQDSSSLMLEIQNTTDFDPSTVRCIDVESNQVVWQGAIGPNEQKSCRDLIPFLDTLQSPSACLILFFATIRISKKLKVGAGYLKITDHNSLKIHNLTKSPLNCFIGLCKNPQPILELQLAPYSTREIFLQCERKRKSYALYSKLNFKRISNKIIA